MQEWCPVNLTRPHLSFLDWAAVSSNKILREKTTETYLSFLDKRLGAGIWQWFLNIYSDALGAIHYCNIAQYDFKKQQMRLWRHQSHESVPCQDSYSCKDHTCFSVLWILNIDSIRLNESNVDNRAGYHNRFKKCEFVLSLYFDRKKLFVEFIPRTKITC